MPRTPDYGMARQSISLRGQGKTQKQVAIELGIGESSVRRYEKTTFQEKWKNKLWPMDSQLEQGEELSLANKLAAAEQHGNEECANHVFTKRVIDGIPVINVDKGIISETIVRTELLRCRYCGYEQKKRAFGQIYRRV